MLKILQKIVIIIQRNGFIIVSLLFCFTLSSSATTIKPDIGYKHFNILHQDNSYNSDFSESFFKADVAGKSKYFHWSFSLIYNRPDGGLEWGSVNDNYPLDSSSEFIGNLDFKDESLESKFNLSNSTKSLGTYINWKLNRDNKNDVAAKLWWQPIKYILGYYKLGMKNSFPSSSEVFYKYSSDNSIKFEGGRINWIIPNEYKEISIKLFPINKLSLQYKYIDMLYEPDEPSTKVVENNVYEGHLDGSAYDKKYNIKYHLHDKSHISLAYRKIELESRLRSYYQNQTFGYFGIVDGSYESTGLHYLHGSRKISISYSEAEGEIKGVIEAWPFFDGLLRFIGERRHFVSEADAYWFQFSLSDKLYRFKIHQLFGSLDFYRIEPNASYASWRPLLFGFGIDDLRSDKLNIETASLMRLEISDNFKIDKFSIDIKVSQWIPLQIKKTDKNKDEPSGGGGSTTPSPNSSTKTTGGFEFGLNISRNF